MSTLIDKDAGVYLGKALQDTNAEWEAVYGNTDSTSTLTKSQFMRVLHTLRNKMICTSESHTLDIRRQQVHINKTTLSDIRATIEGIQDIQSYCKKNDLSGIPCMYIRKTPYVDSTHKSVTYKSLKNTDYNYRINLKSEVNVSETDSEVEGFRDGLATALKYFRYKKRYSFETDDKLFRIDLTAVKTSDYNFKTRQRSCYISFMKSGILHSKELYEIEIEYIGSHKHELSSTIAIDDFLNKVISRDHKLGKTLSSSVHKGTNVFSSAIPQVIQESETPILSEPGDCEFPEEIPEGVPPEYKDPTDDIRYNYWIASDQEWILTMMQTFDKKLSFIRMKENTTATYENAPENTTYMECMIYPQITQDEKDEFQEILGSDVFSWPDTYGGRIMIPLSEIQGTPESLLDPISSEGGKLTSEGESDKEKILQVVVDAVLQQFQSHLHELLCCIQDVKLLLSETTKKQVIKQYEILTRQGSKVKFMGPDPVTLTLQEMLPENPHSILQGYVVTEKADGYRAQLMITQKKHGYLIRKSGSHIIVIDTGWTFKDTKGSWLFDGEYITKDKQGNQQELYMVFDVYYAGDGSNTYPDHAYTYPWSATKSHSRSSILFEFRKQVDYEESLHPTLTLGFKTYLNGPKALKLKKNTTTYSNMSAMGKMCHKILSTDMTQSGYGYTIDGLIFMPMHSPVKSTSEIPVDSISGRWTTNYKWKPPEENTIDFKVKIVKETYQKKQRDKCTSIVIDSKVVSCKQVHLIVGYDEKQDTQCDYTWKLLTQQKGSSVKEILFHPPNESTQIHICNIPLVEGKMLCARDKVELRDDMIVEMSYHPEAPEGARWKPLRERFDKSSPQFFTVANNVWDTIQYPVTDAMVRGKDLKEIPDILSSMPKDEDAYYIGTDESSRDQPLRKFHNFIKQRLINDICSSMKSKDGTAILDTSVGRGGDIKKYLGSDCKISFFLGLDISSNINEAGKRYYFERMSKPNAMFIQYDTSLPIHTGEGCVGTDKDIKKNKHLIDILYKNNKSLPKEFRQIEREYRGLGTKSFQVISSQFSLHYYFKDESTLRGFLQNLQDNCTKGGYFIGTCYDGMKVFQTLQDTQMIDMKDEYGKLVYSITKNYEIDSFTYSPDMIDMMFGQEIEVYMNSIGQTITEYLVNFEMFIELMKEYGFSLTNPQLKGKQSGIFDQKDFTYQPGMGGFDQIISKLSNLSSKDPRIKKYHSDALQILSKENGLLRKLSSLNNWFVFQKD